jgi:hypothetical protein
MAAGIECRVSQHRNPDEFQAIENTTYHITPSAPPAGLAALVNMIFEFIGFITSAGNDAVIGANHGAHGTADTSVSRVCLLPDAVIAFICHGWGLRQIRRGLEQPLAKYPQLNGIYRAYCSAFTAKVAFFFIP